MRNECGAVRCSAVWHLAAPWGRRQHGRRSLHYRSLPLGHRYQARGGGASQLQGRERIEGEKEGRRKRGRKKGEGGGGERRKRWERVEMRVRNAL